MTYYEIWFNLKDSSKDLEFCNGLSAYLGKMKSESLIEGYALKRRKLGFGPPDLGEFNLTIEVTDMAQLENAFQRAASREPGIENLHSVVYSKVKDFTAGLTRDFPDPVRLQPEEDARLA